MGIFFSLFFSLSHMYLSVSVFVCICVCIYVICTTCMHGAQKRILDPLELEFTKVLSHQVVAGN